MTSFIRQGDPYYPPEDIIQAEKKLSDYCRQLPGADRGRWQLGHSADRRFVSLAEQYKKQRDDLLEFMKGAQVSSGVCCCGDMMDKHASPMICGHNPVDIWDHAVMSYSEEIAAFDEAHP